MKLLNMRGRMKNLVLPIAQLPCSEKKYDSQYISQAYIV